MKRPKKLVVDRILRDGVTYQLELVKCGKPLCRTCAVFKRSGHGPYWYAYEWSPERRKLVSTYIGKRLPRKVARWYSTEANALKTSSPSSERRGSSPKPRKRAAEPRDE